MAKPAGSDWVSLALQSRKRTVPVGMQSQNESAVSEPWMRTAWERVYYGLQVLVQRTFDLALSSGSYTAAAAVAAVAAAVFVSKCYSEMHFEYLHRIYSAEAWTGTLVYLSAVEPVAEDGKAADDSENDFLGERRNCDVAAGEQSACLIVGAELTAAGDGFAAADAFCAAAPAADNMGDGVAAALAVSREADGCGVAADVEEAVIGCGTYSHFGSGYPTLDCLCYRTFHWIQVLGACHCGTDRVGFQSYGYSHHLWPRARKTPARQDSVP